MTEKPARLLSIDALRGFDMFWIIGGDYLVHFTAAATGWATLSALSYQLQHAEWAGLRLYDLVFPLFMFLSGVSVALALGDVQPERRGAIIRRAGRRAAILAGLGIIYNFGWAWEPERFRVASVLGLSGFAYFVTVVIYCRFAGAGARFLCLLGVLAGVAALQLGVAPPGGVAGDLTPGGSINAWIDQTFLPGRLYGGAYDPEGLLGMASGISITLAGALCGAALRRGGVSPGLALRLGAIGTGAFLAGLFISPAYPPIKKIWTATFDIMAIGACMVVLAATIFLVEHKGVQAPARPFAVIGMNSIAIYMGARFLAYPVFLWASRSAIPPAAAALIVAGVIAAEWAALAVAYRKKWFLSV
ncbi:MAG: hypothetical protein AAF869_09265 [Pseudomonadota bacterium]